MTDEQFRDFAERLLVQFPSLHEWLVRNSPDPVATQELWRATLRRYTIQECMAVLDAWQQSSAAPFAAYERDQVAAIIASCCTKRREAEAKKREQDQMVQSVMANRQGAAYTMLASDVGMREAFEQLQPLHAQMIAGEMDEAEYRRAEQEVLSKL